MSNLHSLRLPPFVKLALTLFLLLSLVIAQSSWAYTFEEVAALLSKPAVVSADFTQERHIKSMNKPLLSSGVMLSAREHGLLWEQHKPFLMSFRANANQMVQKVGEQVEIVERDKQPQLFAFNHIFQAMFRADQRILEEYFSYHFADKTASWLITLTPIKEPLNRVFKTIELEGTDTVERVVIQDQQGDRTLINFTNVITSPTLSPEQAQRLLPTN